MKMTNIVNGDTVTAEKISEIVDQFEYADEQHRKAAIDKVNNSVFKETDLDDLSLIAETCSASRVRAFIASLILEDLSEYDIAAGLGNGDIERPEWLGVSEGVDHIKLWAKVNMARCNISACMPSRSRCL